MAGDVRTSMAARYRLNGKGTEWFAFKVLNRWPDFDPVVRLASPGAMRDVTVPLQGLGQRSAELSPPR